MRITGLVLAALFALTSATVAAPSPSVAPPGAVQAADPDDPYGGRWTPEVLSETAEGLMKARREGGPAQADRVLAAMLARTADPAERSRVLTAYGLQLMMEGADEPIQAAAEALPYMKQAVGEGRQGFAGESRMLAMLLSDAATTEFMAKGAETSAEAEAWMEEAHRIRVALLGARHIETVSTLVYLADIRGAALQPEGDPARVQAIADLYQPLLFAQKDETGERDLTFLFNKWTAFLAGAGRPDEACAVLDKMNGLAARMDLDMDYAAYALGEALSEAGYADRAAPLIGPDAAMALLAEESDAPSKSRRCGP